MGGWIKLYRDIRLWQHWQEPTVLLVFLDLLLSANSDTAWVRGTQVKRGELLTSVATIMASTGIASDNTVRTALEKLCESGEIKKTRIGNATKVTIKQYDKYQGCAISAEPTAEPTAELVAELVAEPTADKQEVKKEEKKKSTEKKAFLPPTAIEVADYCKEIGSHIDVGYFMAYYEINGWKVNGKQMKNWKLTVQTWTAKDRSSHPELYQAPEQPKQEQKWQTLKSIPKKQQ